MSGQLDTLTRGIVDLHVRAELEEKIASGKPMLVKAGFDPTRPDLHLGHTVLLSKMRQFQDFGHTAVFVVGDFTAMVGDPTGRSDLRPRLTRQEVIAAAETYQTQAFKVLDRDRTIVRYNSEWLGKLTPVELIELCAKYTVARMLERDDFSKRYAAERPIYVHEFLYPLLQAYDSVVLENDIELGGTDQLFNLLVARDVMPRFGKKAQMVMTTPLLEGINARVEDGRVVGAKMSKSADNYVGITESPSEMLQKLMLVGDQVIWRYMDLLSPKPTEELRAIRAEVEAGQKSVIEVKQDFAMEIVTRFHDEKSAADALSRRQAVAAGSLPDDIEHIEVPIEGDEVWIAKVIASAGLAKSTSDANRLVQGGAVHLDGRQLTKADSQEKLRKGTRYLLRVGSKNRRFAYVTLV